MPQDDSSERTSQIKQSNAGYPSLEPHHEKILIVVKTTPNPSITYRETVCTAGITENGKWVRLYPLPYRYIDFYKRFSKYQWVNIKIQKRPIKKDFRIDSYEPDCNNIELIGKQLPTGDWKERKKLLFPIRIQSIEEINDLYDKYRISLGMFKPKLIKNFLIEKAEVNWSPKHQLVLNQQTLFEQQPKQLEKVPFKFSYEFICDDPRCTTGHKMKIIDWEITELYRRMKLKYSFSLDRTLEMVKNQWFDKMCNSDRDTNLIVGSIYPRKTFNVLGVFWPPKLDTALTGN